MNNKAESTPGIEEKISQKRRRLLKTAAATAPVIATLHSGAAFANASAYQCINDARTQPPSEETSSPDTWVRVEVKRYKFKHIDNGKKKKTNNWWYDVDGVMGSGCSRASPCSGTFYRIKNGVPKARYFDKIIKILSEETVWVVKYYQPDADNTSVTEVGPYPKFYELPPDFVEKTPINASCLASMTSNNP